MKPEVIDSDLATAMKAGQTDKVGVLRLIKTSFKNEEIKLGHPLSGDEALKVLQREAKQRRDSITAYTDGGRQDLAASEQAELDIINTYLPKQLDETELKTLVDEAVSAAGDSPQMGAVIAAVMAKSAGAADGATVARLVRERLG